MLEAATPQLPIVYQVVTRRRGNESPVLDVDQLFVVGDVMMPFNGKRKFVRSFLPPFFKSALRLESVERAVHFD